MREVDEGKQIENERGSPVNCWEIGNQCNDVCGTDACGNERCACPEYLCVRTGSVCTLCEVESVCVRECACGQKVRAYLNVREDNICVCVRQA
jgi:hypothetical protein